MAKTTKTGVLTTPTAKATTVLEDSSPVLPLPDTPQGVMAVGPRVTFHFVQDYNQANSYDYYDVVNVDGTSYIAIQDVPANTPIANESYWVKWNDPNAQFELLQTTVENFNSRITAAQQDATNANIAVQKINENFVNRKVLMLGNSLTDGVGSSTATNGLFKRLKNMFSECYKKTGSGTGFCPYGSDAAHQVTFTTLLQQAISDPSIPTDEIDEIVINGAWGDSSYFTQVKRDISTYISGMKTNVAAFMQLANTLPNVKSIRYFWCQGLSVNTQTTSAGMCNSANLFIPHIVLSKLLNMYGIQYAGWPGWNTIFQGVLSSDNVHPTDKGYGILEAAWKECYFGGMTYSPIRTFGSVNLSNLINGIPLMAISAVVLPEMAIVSSEGGILTTNITEPVNTPALNEPVTLPINWTSLMIPNYESERYTKWDFDLHPNNNKHLMLNTRFVENGSLNVDLEVTPFTTIRGTKSDLAGSVTPGFVFTNSIAIQQI